MIGVTTAQRELIEKAMTKQHIDILEILLSGHDESTIILKPYLETAAKEGWIKVVKVLVQHGAVITNDIIQLAKDNGHNGTAHYLAITKVRQNRKKG